MNRAAWEAYIEQTYQAQKDHPWTRYPNYAVFRRSNHKCFAILMELPQDKLGLQGQDWLTVVNLKCNPLLIGSLLLEKGFFPAYHMSKEHWITAALDGSVSEDRIKMLLDMSFEATAPRRAHRARGGI